VPIETALATFQELVAVDKYNLGIALDIYPNNNPYPTVPV